MKDLIETSRQVLLEQSDNRPGANVDLGPTGNMKGINPNHAYIKPRKNKAVVKDNLKKGLKVKIVGHKDSQYFGQTGVVTDFGLSRAKTLSAQLKLDKKVGNTRSISKNADELEIV